MKIYKYIGGCFRWYIPHTGYPQLFVKKLLFFLQFDPSKPPKRVITQLNFIVFVFCHFQGLSKTGCTANFEYKHSIVLEALLEKINMINYFSISGILRKIPHQEVVDIPLLPGWGFERERDRDVE